MTLFAEPGFSHPRGEPELATIVGTVRMVAGYTDQGLGVTRQGVIVMQGRQEALGGVTVGAARITGLASGRKVRGTVGGSLPFGQVGMVMSLVAFRTELGG